MADAGGGAKWEPFEIMLIVVLLVGVFMHFDGKSISTPEPTPTPDSTSIEQPSTSSCGLTIQEPRVKATAKGAVRLRGQTNGCNWPSKNGVVLYAQVVDMRGTPVSVYTPVTSLSQSEPLVFDFLIPFTTQPAKGVGYLILIPLEDGNGHADPVRIPITLQ